jgi:predicted RNA-binding Zn-ribbon protein involved in translation (DUF1610 family)
MGSWGEQFSCGDQSEDSRASLWRSGFSECPRCHAKKIQTRSECAGCRHNGDVYGTDVFTCGECGWCTSFQYDDASVPYYYETQYFSREQPVEDRPPSEFTPLTDKDRSRYGILLRQGAPLEAVRNMMTIKKHNPLDIDNFLGGLTS